MEESAEILRGNRDHLEITLHGVGHEHWEKGRMSRAEWYGSNECRDWGRGTLEGHLHLFDQILQDHCLGSFPESFVPCAFCYHWSEDASISTGDLMKQAGMRHISTPFSACTFDNTAPETPEWGFDQGVLVLDRGDNGVPWKAFDTVPQDLPTTSICGIHWPNLLRPNPAENEESIEHWIRYLSGIEEVAERMLARNTAECFSQTIYAHYGKINKVDGYYELDLSAIPASVLESGYCNNLVLKAALSPELDGQCFRSNDFHLKDHINDGKWLTIRLQKTLRLKGRFSFQSK
jgi:hypothetical protein